MDANSGGKSFIGLDYNITALLTYVVTYLFGLIPYVGYIAFAIPIVVYLLEKNSSFVRWHAVNIIGLSVVMAIIGIILAIINGIIIAANPLGYTFGGGFVIIGVISFIIFLAFAVLYGIAAVKAYQNQKFNIPVISGFADKYAR